MAASAAKTGLADAGMDFITAAQAFHWFDRAAFAAEARRILKPQGKVALIWNSRDEKSALVKETKAICEKYCPAFRGFSGGQTHSAEAFDDFFLAGTLETQAFGNPLFYTEAHFVGRHLTASYAPKEK